MSVSAVKWALQQPIRPSTSKFVLVVLAESANDENELTTWVSIAYIIEATGQDRKTVIAGLNRLREEGYITDTGKRAGNTKQVIVYRVNSTENGTVKESQKRNGTENGTVPDFPVNSTEIPAKQSQNSLETVPKTVPGTIRNHKVTVREPSTRVTLSLPTWLPAESWSMWDRFRKQKSGKGWTEDAKQLSIKKLEKLMAAGNDPTAVIEQAVERGWTGLFEIRAPNAVTTQTPSRAERHANWNERLNQVVDASLQPERPRVIDMGTIDASS